MKRMMVTAMVALICALGAVAPASAEEGDSATLAVRSSRIGERALLVLEVVVPSGATVEVDPAAGSWRGVEVVAIQKLALLERAGRSIAHLELMVAAFQPGPIEFAPAVNIIEGTTVTPRELPAVAWNVEPTVSASDPLELSALARPAEIEGAESAFLRPAVGLGGAAALAIAAAGLYGGGRRVARSRQRPAPVAAVATPDAPDLTQAEAAIHHDPVTAYRTLAAIVRGVIANEYGVPAHALTSSELRRRMESTGADRFRARLVGGFLEECDAVVYAGYRPAAERRAADLTMAREIVEGRA